MPEAETRCQMCGTRWVHFQPARKSVRYVQAVCWKCGRRGLPGIDEEDALDGWDKANDPKAFVKKLA